MRRPDRRSHRRHRIVLLRHREASVSAQPSEKTLALVNAYMTVCIQHEDDRWECSCPDDRDRLQLALSIDTAIREAVEEEREACALICETERDCCDQPVRVQSRYADEIRARSAQEGK